MTDTDQLRDRLTRVETKLDIVIDELRKTHGDHETRIRAIEARIGRWTGGIAVIAILVGGASGTIASIIQVLVK